MMMRMMKVMMMKMAVKMKMMMTMMVARKCVHQDVNRCGSSLVGCGMGGMGVD